MTTTVMAAELAVSTTATTLVATSVSAEPLLTALIGFGVSLVTMVGGELVKFLVAFFKKKTNDIKRKEDDKDANKN